MFTYHANDKTPCLREIAAHYPPHIKTVLRLLKQPQHQQHGGAQHNSSKNNNNNISNNENHNHHHSNPSFHSNAVDEGGVGKGEVGVVCCCHPVAWCLLGSSCLSQVTLTCFLHVILLCFCLQKSTPKPVVVLPYQN